MQIIYSARCLTHRRQKKVSTEGCSCSPLADHPLVVISPCVWRQHPLTLPVRCIQQLLPVPGPSMCAIPLSELPFKLSFLAEMSQTPSITGASHLSSPGWSTLPSYFPQWASSPSFIWIHHSHPWISNPIYLTTLCVLFQLNAHIVFPILFSPAWQPLQQPACIDYLLGGSTWLHDAHTLTTDPSQPPMISSLQGESASWPAQDSVLSSTAGATSLPFHSTCHTGLTCLALSKTWLEWIFKRKANHFTFRYIIKATFISLRELRSWSVSRTSSHVKRKQ